LLLVKTYKLNVAGENVVVTVHELNQQMEEVIWQRTVFAFGDGDAIIIGRRRTTT
jgi:hypothetical protein